jgi:Ca2+-binding RTX toxin-like protein
MTASHLAWLPNSTDLSSTPPGDISVTAASTLQISGLNGDSVLFNTTGTVSLDNTANATVTASTPLSQLQITYSSGTSSEHLGINTTAGTVTLPHGLIQGGRVVVQGTTIGTISLSNQKALGFQFNDEATAVRVQELIRALTYSNTAPTDGFSSQGVIEIRLYDKNNALTQANVAVIDNIVGTAANDTFSCTANNLSSGDLINGGGGTDTLQLAGGYVFEFHSVGTLTSIETLQGSAADELIRIKAEQLNDVRTINGGGHIDGNRLEILGTSINLTGKTVVNFKAITLWDDNATITLDNKDTAKLVEGFFSENDTLILTNGILSDDERHALHRKGVDTVINNGVTTRYQAPVITGLDGDRVSASSGQPVFVDAGRNMTISADDVLTFLSVSSSHSYGRIGIDTAGAVSLSNGLSIGSKIKVGAVEIGTIADDFSSTLGIRFTGDAPENLVQELVRALTYTCTGSTASSAAHEIRLSFRDGGARTTDATVFASVTDAPPAHTVNILKGTKGKDVLKGGSGQDIIYGYHGKDVLTGNGGQDIFVFDTKANTKTNRDTITDYSVAEDTIWLSDRYFKKLGKGTEASPTKLKKAFFKVADKAKDKNDYLVYNKKTGVLSYDADGSGSAKAVEIAKLTKNLKLTQDDFFVV